MVIHDINKITNLYHTIQQDMIPTQLWQQLIVGGVSGKICDVISIRQHRTRRDVTALSHT